MWQARSPFLICFYWILLIDTADTSNTVQVTEGSQAVLDCPLSSVITNIQWFGPPEDITYTLVGSTNLNPSIPASVLARLAVNSTTGALIINNTQLSDVNNYTCRVDPNVTIVQLTVSATTTTSTTTTTTSTTTTTTTPKTTTATISTSPHWWCTQDWCIGLVVASGGTTVVAIIVGIIIFIVTRRDTKNRVAWQITAIVVALLVVCVIAVTGFFAGFVCLCWREQKQYSQF